VDAQAWTGFCAAGFQLGLDGVAQAYQNDIDIGIRLQAAERGRHGNVRAMVPAHAVDGYRGIHRRIEATPPG
jgi:hypothetical protein